MVDVHKFAAAQRGHMATAVTSTTQLLWSALEGVVVSHPWVAGQSVPEGYRLAGSPQGGHEFDPYVVWREKMLLLATVARWGRHACTIIAGAGALTQAESDPLPPNEMKEWRSNTGGSPSRRTHHMPVLGLYGPTYYSALRLKYPGATVCFEASHSGPSQTTFL